MELGITVRDKVTGVQGVVTGHVRYMTGCNQALVQPKAKEDGTYVDSHWFDEQRLERVGTDQIVLDNEKTPGADKAPPRR